MGVINWRGLGRGIDDRGSDFFRSGIIEGMLNQLVGFLSLERV